jgi:hypothetical protein
MAVVVLLASAAGSTSVCGKNVKVRRRQAGVNSTIWAAPGGVEVAYLQAALLGGTPTLAFARYACASGNFGAYRIRAG